MLRLTERGNMTKELVKSSAIVITMANLKPFDNYPHIYYNESEPVKRGKYVDFKV